MPPMWVVFRCLSCSLTNNQVMNLMRSEYNSLSTTLLCIREGLDKQFIGLEQVAQSARRDMETEVITFLLPLCV